MSSAGVKCHFPSIQSKAWFCHGGPYFQGARCTPCAGKPRGRPLPASAHTAERCSPDPNKPPTQRPPQRISCLRCCSECVRHPEGDRSAQLTAHGIARSALTWRAARVLDGTHVDQVAVPGAFCDPTTAFVFNHHLRTGAAGARARLEQTPHLAADLIAAFKRLGGHPQGRQIRAVKPLLARVHTREHAR